MSLTNVNFLQRSNQGHNMMMHTYIPIQCPQQVSTFYNLRFPRYRLDKNFKLEVTTVRSKVKLRSHHHMHTLAPNNVHTKYQPSIPYRFRDIVWTRFWWWRSLQQGQIKVKPWCCTPTLPIQCPYKDLWCIL